jgi:hypothetical protein
MWAALALLLVCPLVAMQFTSDVRWDAADFAAGAALLAGLGLAIEAAFRLSKRARTRALLVGMAVVAVITIWADAAVGIF